MHLKKKGCHIMTFQMRERERKREGGHQQAKGTNILSPDKLKEELAVANSKTKRSTTKLNEAAVLLQNRNWFVIN